MEKIITVIEGLIAELETTPRAERSPHQSVVLGALSTALENAKAHFKSKETAAPNANN
jgi:hypothetical protein